MRQPNKFDQPRQAHLDVIRIGACLWVLLDHWSGHGADYFALRHPYSTEAYPQWLMAFSSLGYLGVDIFFVLSGYVIIMTSISTSHKPFFTRRVARLFPAYLFATVLSLCTFSQVARDFDMSGFIPSLTGVQFWFSGISVVGSAWSLQYELQFYFLVAFVIYALNRKGIVFNAEFSGYALLFWEGFGICFQNSQPGVLSKFLMLDTSKGTGFVFYFCFGGFLFLTKLNRNSAVNRIGLYLALVGSYFEIEKRLELTPEFRPRLTLGILLLVSLGIFIFYGDKIFQRIKPGISRKWISNSLTLLGLMTYPMYLLHETFGISIIQFLLHEKFQLWSACFWTFMICSLLSFLVVKIVEPHGKRLILSFMGRD